MGGSIFVIAISILIILNSGIGFGISQADDALAAGDTQTNEEDTTPINAVYGTITSIGNGTLEVAVELGGDTIPFTFSYNDETQFSTFAYANDDDLVGTESNVSSNALTIGNKISVYSDEELRSTSTKHATRVVILLQ